jgi:membrane associated rhomboid family serine protease
MPPRRTSPDLTRVFTIGGRVPPSVGALLIVTGVATILNWQNRAVGQAWAALFPGAILSGEIWRLVSWFFVQGDPFGLLFVALMLWWLGPQLVYAWGEKRFVLRLLGITVGASLVTTALAVVWPEARAPHLGAWPTINALIVSWALLYPDRQVNLWGILPVTGRTLALLVVGGTVLYAVFGGVAGFGAFLPHFAAMGIAYLLARGLTFSGVFRRAKRGMADREQKRRAKHLKVVQRDGGDRPGRWMN